MNCCKCGDRYDESVSFCRRCGTELRNSSLTLAAQNLQSTRSMRGRLVKANSKDPDELTSNGVGSVIVGDGFFMVAVILSAINSSVSSPLWLFLLIPAFYFFGKGFADVLHARQIRRQQKRDELNEAVQVAELPPPRASVMNTLKKTISGELAIPSSITERTTRDLS